MRTIAIIPARLGSTRLNEKPLIKVNGKSIVQYVYENLSSPLIDKKIIATDSVKIKTEVDSFGGEVILTSPTHKNGTERCIEVLEHFPDYDLVLNIQGDEPLVNDEVVVKLILPFEKDPLLKMSTLMKPISHEEAKNSDTVKVITDINQSAIYFSRSVIPFDRDQNTEVNYFKHLGFYAYRKDFMADYLKLPVCEIENVEKLEQLRVLYHGIKIHVNEIDLELIDINTVSDVEKFKNYLDNHSTN